MKGSFPKIKRPLALFSALYFAGIAAGLCLSVQISAVLGAAFAFLSAVIFIFFKRYSALFLTVLALSAAFSICALKVSFFELNEFKGEDAVYSAEGFISGVYYYNDRQTLLIEPEKLDGQAVHSMLPIKVGVQEHLKLSTGDMVRVDLKLSRNGIDDGESLYTRGISAYGEAQGEIEVFSSEKIPINLMMLNLRNRLCNGLKTVLNGVEGDIVNKMAFGCMNGVDAKTTQMFYKSGIGHLLAVSGLHVSIVCGAAMLLLSKIGLSKRLSSVLSIALCIFYVVMTGAPYSAMRAGIMMIIFCIANILGRNYDSLNALSVAVLIILTVSPQAVVNKGFLFSVGCTLSIILFSKRIFEFINSLKMLSGLFKYKTTVYFAESVSLTLSASIALILFSAVGMGEVPLFSVLFNMLSAPIAPIILIFGILCAVFACIGGIFMPAAYLSGIMCGFPIKILTAVSAVGWNLRGFSLSFDDFPMASAIAAAVFFIVISSEKHGLHCIMGKKAIAFLTVSMLIVSVFAEKLFYMNNVHIISDIGYKGSYMLNVYGTDILYIPPESYESVKSAQSLSEKGADSVCDILICPYADDKSDMYIEKICSKVYPKTLVTPDELSENKRLLMYCDDIESKYCGKDMLTVEIDDGSEVKISFGNTVIEIDEKHPPKVFSNGRCIEVKGNKAVFKRSFLEKRGECVLLFLKESDFARHIKETEPA